LAEAGHNLRASKSPGKKRTRITVFLLAFLLTAATAGMVAGAPHASIPDRLLAAANNPPQTLNLRVNNRAPDNNNLIVLPSYDPYPPVFSWTFYDPDGDQQTDFQVWVGSSPGNADLWSSGTIHSSSNWVEYNFNGTGKKLQSGVTYYLQVRTRDGNTWSEWAIVAFRINRRPIVSNLTVTEDGPVFSWTYYDPDGDLQSHYWVQVWTWFFDLVWNTGPVAGDNTSVRYNYDGRGEPLEDGKTYYVCVAVRDGYEWSWWVWTQFTVDIPPVVTQVYVQGYAAGTDGILHITDNAPDISWSYYDPGDTQTDYRVEVWTSAGRTGTLMDTSYAVSSSSTTYRYGSSAYQELPLIDGENYYVSVRVKAGGKWSDWMEARFRMNTAPDVGGLRVQGYPENDPMLLRITDRTPEVSWRYSDNDGDNQTKYRLRVWHLPGMELAWDSGPVENGENRATCENTLADGESYRAGVMVKDGYEWSPENFINFRVNSKPLVTNLSAGGFPTPIVRWDYSDGDGDPQRFYRVQFWSGPGGTGENLWDSGAVESASTSANYGGAPLVDGETYYVRASVSDNYEWSDWTEISFVYGSDPLNPGKLGALKVRTMSILYPDQTYVYEGGAVILVQEGREMMISYPSMIAAGDVRENEIWVRLRWVLIETENPGAVIGGISTAVVTTVENFIRISPLNGPNRKEVTISVNSQYAGAWSEYLSRINENLKMAGYLTSLDNLRLTIYGKDPDSKDIYFTEEVIRLRVSLS